ncbi:deaminase [Aeromonas salmonicida]
MHAEMDAITSLARLDGPSSKNKIIYTTTYPCHNCARHIVAAGIKKPFI